MAEYYGYFNGLEYDEDFVSLVNSILVQNGVFGDGLMVSANSGMTVNASQGAAIINGFIYYNDSALPLTIQTANATLPRIDSIMLRWDIPNSTMNLIVVTGTAQSNPTAPSPTRNGTYYDMQIATVYVGAGVESISSANITDTRPNSDVCGITSGYNSVDIDLLMTQYTAQFNDWFEQIKGQLSTDAAGNLQNQINELDSNTVKNTTTINGKALSSNVTLAPSDLEIEDYIVEEGTSGIWTYRKWNSGISECWGQQSETVDITTAFGNMYRTDGVSIMSNYPSGLFNAPPVLTYSVESNVSVIATPNTTLGTATSTQSIQIIRPTSRASTAVTIYWIAKGTWK